jgi:hypothetical protein
MVFLVELPLVKAQKSSFLCVRVLLVMSNMGRASIFHICIVALVELCPKTIHVKQVQQSSMNCPLHFVFMSLPLIIWDHCYNVIKKYCQVNKISMISVKICRMYNHCLAFVYTAILELCSLSSMKHGSVW